MRRDRVAVVGRPGLFKAGVVAALKTNRRIRVRRFSPDGQGPASDAIDEFGSDLVVMVRTDEEPVPAAVISQMERGSAIVTLDHEKPTMGFSWRVRKSHATVESMFDAVQAVRIMRGSRRTSERARRDKDDVGSERQLAPG